MRCPECGLDGYDVLPRYGAPTQKELDRLAVKGVPFTIKAGQHCQTCLTARMNTL